MAETLKRDLAQHCGGAGGPPSQENSLAIDLIWGGEAIAGFLGISTAKLYHLLSRGQMPAVKKVGGSYVASKSALRRVFEAELGGAI